jgi:hypothetical protein
MNVRFAAMAALALSLCACAAQETRFDPLTLEPATFGIEMQARFNPPAPQPAPATVADRAQGQALDAAYFAAFPDLDRAYPPQARERAKSLAHDLERDAASLSHEAFVLRVMEITALADNGHTAIGENAWRKDTPRVPLRTYPFADGLYVVRAQSAYTELLGARIDAIDGHAVEDVFRALRRYAGGTDEHRRRRLLAIYESPAFLAEAGLARERHALTYSGVLADGRAFERRIEAQDRDRAAPVSSSARLLFPSDPAGAEHMASLLSLGPMLPVSLRERSRLFSISPLAPNGLYVMLSDNRGNDDESLPAFLARVLERCAHDSPAYVVLDFRMNGGGDYTLSHPFVVALDELLRDKSHIYVLTSPWTFSAAITTVTALKTYGRGAVTIVGEPVGDRLDFWAEGGGMMLPNAGFGAYYTTGRHIYDGACDAIDCYWLNRFYPVRVDTLDPDIAVPSTFAAYRAGRDPALEAVLARER